MNTIGYLFWTYVDLLRSWWWIVLAVANFISIIVFVLRDDDDCLTTLKAVQLAFVGILNEVPLVQKLLPDLLVIDFLTRWTVLGLGNFRPFVLTMFFFSFFFLPVFALFVFGTRAWDDLSGSLIAAQVRKYGVRDTIKLRLRSR